MDWGFLDSNAGDNKFLREEIVYPNKVSTQHHLSERESACRFGFGLMECIDDKRRCS